MVYKFFDKKKTGSGANASVSEELTWELFYPVFKKFKKGIVHVKFEDYIWAADLAEMESIGWNVFK